jgi:PAS domain-containing protein
MGSLLDFTGGGGGDVRYFPMPDDSMRAHGLGPRAQDIVRYREGRFFEGFLSVCVTLRPPYRVRVGYCRRDVDGVHITFRNPDFPPEDYTYDRARVVGYVEHIYTALPAPRADDPLRLTDSAPVFAAPTSIGGPGVATWESDPSGVGQSFSPNWSELLGGKEEDWRGGMWVNQVHPDDRRRALAAWLESLGTGTPYSISMRLMVRDEYVWTSVMAVPVRDEGGRIIRWRGVLQLRVEVGEQRTA